MKNYVTNVLRGCTLLTLTSILLMSSLSSLAKLAGYDDVPSNAWYGSNLESMSSLGIINGYGDGNFGPQDNLTKAQYITMLVRLLNEEPGAKGQKWWSSYVNKAVELGVMRERDTTDMEDDISRQQMAFYTERVLSLRGETLRPDDGLESQILDWDNIIINKDEVLKCYAAGIITGYPDGSFKGQNKLKRSEALVVLDRILRKEVRKPAVVSDISKEYKRGVELGRVSDNVTWKDGKVIVESMYTKDNATYLPPGSISDTQIPQIHNIIKEIQEVYLNQSKYVLYTEHQKVNDKESIVNLTAAMDGRGYSEGRHLVAYQIYDRGYARADMTGFNDFSREANIYMYSVFMEREKAFEALVNYIGQEAINHLNNSVNAAINGEKELLKGYSREFEGIKIDYYFDNAGIHIYITGLS